MKILHRKVGQREKSVFSRGFFMERISARWTNETNLVLLVLNEIGKKEGKEGRKDFYDAMGKKLKRGPSTGGEKEIRRGPLRGADLRGGGNTVLCVRSGT